jgi:hypothetical protein
MDLAAFVEALPRPSLDRVYDAPEACFAVLRGLPPLARAYVLRLLAVGGDSDDGVGGGRPSTSTATTFVPLDVVASWPLAGDATAQAKHRAALSKLERLAVVVKRDGMALTPAFRRHVASAVALGGAGVVSSSSLSVAAPSAFATTVTTTTAAAVASSTPSHEQRDAFADDAWDGLLLFIGGHEPRAPSRPSAILGGRGLSGTTAPATAHSSSAAAIDFGALLLAEGFVAPRRRRKRRSRGAQRGTGAAGGDEVEEVAVRGDGSGDESDDDDDDDDDDGDDDDDVSAVKPTPKGLSFLLSPTVAQLWELLRCVAAASSAAAESGSSGKRGGGSGGGGSSPSPREDALAAVVALLLKLAAGGGRGPPLAAASLPPAALEAALDASALGLLMPFFVSSEGGAGAAAAAAVKGGRAAKRAKTGKGGQEAKAPQQLWFAPSRLADALRGSGGSINKALSSSSSSSSSAPLPPPAAAAAPSLLVSLPPTATSATSADGHVVVETNFRVYAYTTSPSRRAALSLFASIERVLPNLVVAAVTRSSCLSALDAGVSAEQIVAHLREHASPRVAHRVPVVPENVADQIRLWEASRRRVRSARAATLYSDFSSGREFEAAVGAAVAAGALLWVERGGGVGGSGVAAAAAAGGLDGAGGENRHGRLAAAVEAHERIKEAIRAARGM